MRQACRCMLGPLAHLSDVRQPATLVLGVDAGITIGIALYSTDGKRRGSMLISAKSHEDQKDAIQTFFKMHNLSSETLRSVFALDSPMAPSIVHYILDSLGPGSNAVFYRAGDVKVAKDDDDVTAASKVCVYALGVGHVPNKGIHK